jgi:hypothetical protein
MTILSIAYLRNSGIRNPDPISVSTKPHRIRILRTRKHLYTKNWMNHKDVSINLDLPLKSAILDFGTLKFIFCTWNLKIWTRHPRKPLCTENGVKTPNSKPHSRVLPKNAILDLAHLSFIFMHLKPRNSDSPPSKTPRHRIRGQYITF